MKTARHLITACTVLLAAGTVAAAPVTPDSYNMLNGNTGSFQYWDQIYTGAGCVTCDNAALSGGRGDLTDGIIAANNWFVDEAPAGNGPYVGWTLNPTITFHWTSAITLNSLTFYLDDANGAGGVSAPSSIVVDGVSHAVADPAGSAPFAFTVSGLSFTGTDLVVTLNRRNSWVFLSEVSFDGVAPGRVPEPGSLALLAAALGALGFSTRRSRSRSR